MVHWRAADRFSIDKRASRLFAPHQAPADECLGCEERRRLRGQRSRVVACRPGGKDREHFVECSLTSGEALIAPVDGGPQSSLPLGQVDRPLHLEGEPLAECTDDLAGRKDCEASRNEFDRKWKTIEPSADLANRS